MTLGLLAALPERAVDVVAIDRDADALRIAAAAAREFGGTRASIVTRVADVAHAELPTADLIAIGSTLNELAASAREVLVLRALAALADDGALIIIEPALRETSRALHALRDSLLARGAAHVFAPCTRTATPCPALDDERDWCHEDRPLRLPPHADAVARATHLRDGGMRFAYLVLRKAPLPLVAHPGALRVVSAPMPAKGKLELFACGESGRVKLRLLSRARSPGNRAFADAGRGDVVVLDRPEPEITAETTVERIAPAGER
jgi:hypothetical protein